EVPVRGAEFETRVRLNAEGLRGPEIRPRAEVARRVLLLGDAFALGYAVSEEQTLRAQLETRLGGAPRVEVLNAGVTGYGTEQEVLFERCRGARLQPDVVVVLFRAEDVTETSDRTPDAPCPADDGSDAGGVIPARAYPGPLRPPDNRPWRGSVALAD